MIKVGICGGIGSGKSTVCQLLSAKGVPVYDSDSRAKMLMNSSTEIIDSIKRAFGEGSYKDSILDNHYLAERVFGNANALELLDSIVHPAVKSDFVKWSDAQNADYVVLESAILFESGLNEYVDKIVAVLAPQSLRIERAMGRDGANREQILERMGMQITDEELLDRVDLSIVNINRDDLEHDVAELDNRLRVISQLRNK